MVIRKIKDKINGLTSLQALFVLSFIGYVILSIYGLINYKSRLIHDSAVELLSYHNNSLFDVYQYRFSPLLNKLLLGMSAIFDWPMKVSAILYIVNDVLFYPLIAFLSYRISKKLMFPTLVFLQVLLVHKHMYFGVYHEILLTANLTILFVALFYSKLPKYLLLACALIVGFFLCYTHPISVLFSAMLILLVAFMQKSKEKTFLFVIPFFLLLVSRFFFIDSYDVNQTSLYFTDLTGSSLDYLPIMVVMLFIFYPFFIFNIINIRRYKLPEVVALVATLLFFGLFTYLKQVIFISPEFPKLGLPFAAVSLFLILKYYNLHFTNRIARFALYIMILFAGAQYYFFGMMVNNHVNFYEMSVACAKKTDPNQYKWVMPLEKTIFCDVYTLSGDESIVFSLIDGYNPPYVISRITEDYIDCLFEIDTDSTYFTDVGINIKFVDFINEKHIYPTGYYKLLDLNMDTINADFPPNLNYCTCNN